jgi:hypothetical protein
VQEHSSGAVARLSKKTLHFGHGYVGGPLTRRGPWRRDDLKFCGLDYIGRNVELLIHWSIIGTRGCGRVERGHRSGHLLCGRIYLRPLSKFWGPPQYLPNGNPAPGPKFDCEMLWLEGLTKHAEMLLAAAEPVVLVGDYNVIPTELDII